MTGSVVTDGGGDVIKGYTISAAGGRRRVSLNWTFLHSTCTKWWAFGCLFYFLWWLPWPILGMVAMDSTTTLTMMIMAVDDVVIMAMADVVILAVEDTMILAVEVMVFLAMEVMVILAMEVMVILAMAVMVILAMEVMVFLAMEDKVIMFTGDTVMATEGTVDMVVIDMVVGIS
ncbi:hypothetical protein Hamer_G024455 [Homarus americanus]|uniref:Uncharacterized protein n=1 Tax=Homarus americanus TaxID=6706 RepID=A0A8J5JH24_HOMAM|nr:hypothetical protein Hamer_G024455 [Homarus americanus]